MFRRHAAAAAALISLTGAVSCSDSDSERSTAELETRLISLDDLPAGWTDIPRQTFLDGVCAKHDLVGIGSVEQTGTAFEQAEGTEAQELPSQWIIHRLAQFRSSARAETTIETIRETVEECIGQGDSLPIDEHADQTFAVRLNIPVYDVVADLVVTREDNLLSYLFVAADPEAVDTELTETLADVAAEKLEA